MAGSSTVGQNNCIISVKCFMIKMAKQTTKICVLNVHMNENVWKVMKYECQSNKHFLMNIHCLQHVKITVLL